MAHRPSAAMLVATLALFVALAGGAYAAVAIPADSVGPAQLRNGAVGFAKLADGAVGAAKLANGAVGAAELANGAVGAAEIANGAVTFAKIAPGQIGRARVAQSQIQWRVSGRCGGPYAVQSVSATGAVSCGSTLPALFSTAGLSLAVTSATQATVLATETVPGGSAYHVTSTPYLQVGAGGSGAQNVLVTCELVAGALTEVRSLTFALSASGQAAGSIPMSVDLPAGSASTATAVGCVRSSDAANAAVVQATAGLDALSVGVDVQGVTPGTSSPAFTLTAPTPGPVTSTTSTGTTPSATATTG